jgi:hypothetical protein
MDPKELQVSLFKKKKKGRGMIEDRKEGDENIE